MTDINTVDTNISGNGQDLLKSRATVKDVQHWDYEWEKAFIEHKNDLKERPADRSNGKEGQSQGSDNTNTGQKLIPDANPTQQAVANTSDQFEAEGRYVVKPGAKPVAAAGSAGTEKSATRPVMPQQGILLQPPGMIPMMNSSANGVQNVNPVEQLQSPDWQVVAKNQSTKTGLVVYKTEDNQVKVWLRDRSLIKCQGMRLISELRGMFSGLGVTLAAFTLNGEQLFERNNNSTINITDEVTSWPSKV